MRRVGAGGLSADTVNRCRMGEFVGRSRGGAVQFLAPFCCGFEAVPQTLPRGERRGKGMRSRGCGAARSRNGEDTAPLNAGKGEDPLSCADRLRFASNRRADLMTRCCLKPIIAQPERLGPPHTGGNVPRLRGLCFLGGPVH